MRLSQVPAKIGAFGGIQRRRTSGAREHLHWNGDHGVVDFQHESDGLASRKPERNLLLPFSRMEQTRHVPSLAVSLCCVWLVMAAPASAQQPAAPVERPHNPAQEVARDRPEGPAVDVGPAKLRFGGYVSLAGTYRSTSSGGGIGTSFASIPYDTTLKGNVSESRLTAQASRLSLRVDAPFPE